MKKIAITGHTRGIGLALAERLDQENYEVRGYSKSNGFNILRPNGVIKDIVDWDADVFVNNAYAPEAQSRLLYKIYEQWVDKPKLIINMGATSSDSINNFAQLGYNPDWTPYVSDKARLDWASLQLSNQFQPGKCRVTMIKPGFVDTDSTAWLKGLVDDIMMTPDSVAEMIEWVIELEDNTQMRTLSFDVGNYNG
jgi:NAD(P)-dependent dehydrogenase (short-subunit alcohol dehydrogenase family)|tara:strand:- start:679 stop:1263 length:585 start_codon:yes stop_codon:yes gene_type:complete